MKLRDHMLHNSVKNYRLFKKCANSKTLNNDIELQNVKNLIN